MLTRDKLIRENQEITTIEKQWSNQRFSGFSYYKLKFNTTINYFITKTLFSNKIFMLDGIIW